MALSGIRIGTAEMQKGENMAEITVPIQINLPDDWIEQIVERLRKDPESEWVEIIRCKDCKWFYNSGCAIWINDASDEPKEDDYCSFAERREDDQRRS